MPYLWMTFCFVCSIVTELSLGRCGLLVPTTTLCGFYFAVTFEGKRAALPLLAAFIAVDLGFGRPFPIHLLFLPGTLLLAYYWRHHGNLRNAWVQAVPGLVLGVQNAILEYLHSILRCVGKGDFWVPIQFSDWLMTIFFCLLLTPVLVFCGDFIASLLGIRKYTSAIRLAHVHALMEDSDG